MQKKNQAFSIKGMQRDLSESTFNQEYAYEINNMRITPTDDNTGYALVNEKGTKRITVKGLEDNKLKGFPIGQCVINNYLAVFTHDTTDRIYLITQDDDTYSAKILYEGDLNFSTEHPIEAYPFYENTELQKIYWVDGLNPFRFINIGSLIGNDNTANGDLINAVPTLKLQEEVTITKNYDSGMFAPGTIQYCFTYVKKYAQESAIFYTSPLYYISYKDRGGSPEDKISNSFTITVNNIDNNFDYVRVYAMHRTSIDSAMSSRKVIDLEILEDTTSVSFTDTGTIGDSVADTDILFKTGEEIIPSTFTSKDNTLFLGNFKTNYSSLPNELYDAFEQVTTYNPLSFRYSRVTSTTVDGKTFYKYIPLKAQTQSAYFKNSSYQYNSSLDNSSQKIKIFKYNEWYRLGLQFQYNTGKWSDVIYLEDLQNTLPPTIFESTTGARTRGSLYSDNPNMFAVPTMVINNDSSYTKVTTTNYKIKTVTQSELNELENVIYNAELKALRLLNSEGKETSFIVVVYDEENENEGDYTAEFTLNGTSYITSKVISKIILDVVSAQITYEKAVIESDTTNIVIKSKSKIQASTLDTPDSDTSPVVITTPTTDLQDDTGGVIIGTGTKGGTVDTNTTIDSTELTKDDNTVSTDSITDLVELENKDVTEAREHLDECMELFNSIFNTISEEINYFDNGKPVLDYLKSLGAVKIRPVIVYPDYNDRAVICQGIVESTVYNVNDRYYNLPFAQSSWVTRPNPPYKFNTDATSDSDSEYTFSFYITVFTTFHKSGSYVTLSNKSTHVLQFLNQSLLVTLELLDGKKDDETVTIKGRNCVQARCTTTCSVSKLRDFLMGTAIGWQLVLSNGNSSIEHYDPFATKTGQYPGTTTTSAGLTFLYNNKTILTAAGGSASGRVLNAQGLNNEPYLRWIPVFDGNFKLYEHVNDVVILKNINKGRDNNDGGADFVDEQTYASKPFIINSEDKETSSDDSFIPECESLNDKLDTEGTIAEFRHNYRVPSNSKYNAEIQSLTSLGKTVGTLNSEDKNTFTNKEYWKNNAKEFYYIDQSIVTIHSPEIEFDTNIQNMDLSDVRFRITGMVPIVSNITWNTINVTGGASIKRLWEYDDKTDVWKQKATDSAYSQAAGALQKDIQTTLLNDVSDTSIYWNSGYKTRLTNVLWEDIPFGLFKEFSSGDFSTKTLGFVTYLWQRNGPLNNDSRAKGTATNWIEYKRTSNLHYSNRNAYLPLDYIWEADKLYSNGNTGISRGNTINATLFNSNEIKVVKIKDSYSSNGLVYYGNVDSVVYPTLSSSGANPDGYNIYVSNVTDDGLDHESWISLDDLVGSNSASYISNTVDRHSNYGVRIKYKSTPHIVISLPREGDNLQTILPTFEIWADMNDGGDNVSIKKALLNPSSSKMTSWWDETITGAAQEGIPYYDFNDTYYPSIDFSGRVEPNTIDNGKNGICGPQVGWLWLGELYKEVEDSVRFGGKTKEAIAQNKWYSCGNAVSILDDDGNTKNSIALVWEEGDTYYQRYDHIKTYPFTLEDQNSVTDIISFMVETHVNLDGRYDRNRGNKDNTLVTSENFNQLNEVYSQNNNTFTYYYRNPNLIDLNEWNNTVTWTLTKTAGDIVDKWTHITLASTLDLDGTYGALTSLQKYNDQIVAFQEKAISMIMYNENMQLTTTDGVPIEIGNSGKVTGYRVITDTAGCSNKWSIVSAEGGIYFVDDNTHIAYLFKDGKATNMSAPLGMTTWFNEYATGIDWIPNEYFNIKTWYNPITSDILYQTDTSSDYDTLAYNIVLGTFTSMYSYTNMIWLANVGQKAIAIDTDGYLNILNEGDYNYFFGQYYPYSVEVISNADRLSDKVFTNVDFRSETGAFIDNNWTDYSDITFNEITSANEYQSNTEPLVYKKYGQSNLKRKFRIWSANIPRDSKVKWDRMRNTWLHIKLKMNKTNVVNIDKAKTILHDLNVTYYV